MTGRARRLIAVAAAALLLVPPSARAGGTALERRAEQIVREVLATEPARGAKPGIVIARGGDTLAARNARDPFLPASIQKLPTTLAALVRFGPDHVFTTRAAVTAQRLDGSVGKLVVIGGGDPTLATTAYRTRYLTTRDGMEEGERVFPSGSPTIAELADEIATAGITRVRGNLLADETLFDERRTQDGWKSSYLDRSTGGPHVAYLSALIVNQGFSNIERTRIARSPAQYAAGRLLRALEDRGVEVEGEVVLRATPDGATEVAAVESPPLAEIVGWVNRWSVNHPAELLLKGLGAAFRGEGSTDAGRRVVRNVLYEIGASLDGYRLEDGSGLSMLNRMAPRTVAAILRWALRTTGATARAFRDSFAIACEPGALLRRMCESRAAGNLRGKTGLLSGVRCMAGWVRGRDGTRTIYVAIFNRARDEGALTSTLDLLGRKLAWFP